MISITDLLEQSAVKERKKGRQGIAQIYSEVGLGFNTDLTPLPSLLWPSPTTSSFQLWVCWH